MLVTKDLANKVFNYIYPWGETLESIAWAIRACYIRTVQATTCQAVFIKDLIFNFTSFVDWRVITAGKQQKSEMDNYRKNDR